MTVESIPKETRQELLPDKELSTEDGYRWFRFPPEKTGLTLICLEDLQTGITVSSALANPEKRTAAHKAWAGARHSRFSGEPWEIMHEMGEKGVDPDQKLEDMFANYGHASVGDMARIQLDITGCPMHLPLAVFNEGYINSGQEKSTRYQKAFGKTQLHPMKHYLPESLSKDETALLDEGYQQLGLLALENFSDQFPIITGAYAELFAPETKQDTASLNSRALDTVRFLLLAGQASGFSFETSARDWSRIISDLGASNMRPYRAFASHLNRFLVPTKEEEAYLGFKAEAPGLIKHSEPSTLTNLNLVRLRAFIEGRTDLQKRVPVNSDFRGNVEQKVWLVSSSVTEGDKMVAQYLLTLWPGLEKGDLLSWIHSQNDEVKKAISGLIFQEHSNYKEMPYIAATTGQTVVVEGNLGEDRDLNRHRGMQRFLNLPLVHGLPITSDTAFQILAKGYGLPSYLTDIPELSDFREAFKAKLAGYYDRLYSFVGAVHEDFGNAIDYSFLINLLPLAHRVDLWMHGNPKQFLYLTHQRTRPGGHINYIGLAGDMNDLIADSDPYLSGMKLDSPPDPGDRERFFNRS